MADENRRRRRARQGKLVRCPVAIVRGLTFEDSASRAGVRSVRPRATCPVVPRSELTPAQRAFLEEKRFAVVGTKNPDGRRTSRQWYGSMRRHRREQRAGTAKGPQPRGETAHERPN